MAGEVVDKAPPTYEHGNAQSALVAFIRRRFHRGANGPDRPGGWWIAVEVDVELEPHEVYRPDVLGWRRDRWPERPTGRPVRMCPDWICEVLSPSTARRDLGTKMRVLHRCGVPHYWIVDAEHQVLTAYRREPGGYLVALAAGRGETVHTEPFDAVELRVGLLFGDEED